MIIYYNFNNFFRWEGGTHEYVQKKIMKYQGKVQNLGKFWIETKTGWVGLLCKKCRELTNYTLNELPSLNCKQTTHLVAFHQMMMKHAINIIITFKKLLQGPLISWRRRLPFPKRNSSWGVFLLFNLCCSDSLEKKSGHRD